MSKTLSLGAFRILYPQTHSILLKVLKDKAGILVNGNYISKQMITFSDTSVSPYLFQVSQWYELVVFTASMEIYGSAVADKLDNSRSILKRRYYRQVSG